MCSSETLCGDYDLCVCMRAASRVAAPLTVQMREVQHLCCSKLSFVRTMHVVSRAICCTHSCAADCASDARGVMSWFWWRLQPVLVRAHCMMCNCYLTMPQMQEVQRPCGDCSLLVCMFTVTTANPEHTLVVVQSPCCCCHHHSASAVCPALVSSLVLP